MNFALLRAPAPACPVPAPQAQDKAGQRSGEIEMPDVLKNQVYELETWAIGNKEDARKDNIRFWALKIPAILVSASSGVFAYFNWQIITLIAGAIASLCVLIDGLNPGGMLRNIHLRALHDLRNLQQDILAQWRAGSLRGEDSNKLAAKIIETIQTERKRIADYIRDAETTLGAGRQTGKD